MNRLLSFLTFLLVFVRATTPAIGDETSAFFERAEALAAHHASELEPVNAFHVIVVLDDGDGGEPFVGTLARFPLTGEKGRVDDKREVEKSKISLNADYEIRRDSVRIGSFKLDLFVELGSGKQIGGVTLGTTIESHGRFTDLKMQRGKPQGISGGMNSYGVRDPNRFVSQCVYVVWK